jgi:hypothetical protein
MRMANDASNCGGQHCRFSALSTDGGASFSPAAPVRIRREKTVFPLLLKLLKRSILLRQARDRHREVSKERGCFSQVPSLISSGCQGSVLLHEPSKRLLFSNPHSTTARKNGVLQYSEDNAKTWHVGSTIDAGDFAYSCLSLLPAVALDGAGAAAAATGGVNGTHVAVLYEGSGGHLLLATQPVQSPSSASNEH